MENLPVTQSAYFGILAAVFFNIILGIVWYSPNILGKLWLTAYKFESATLFKPTIRQYVGTVFVSIVLAFVLWIIVDKIGIKNYVEAAKYGALFWLAFIATSEYSDVLWEKKPLSGYFIDIGYWLVSLIVTTAIVAIWH